MRVAPRVSGRRWAGALLGPVLAALLLATAACDDVSVPEATIDVDTPQLAQARKDAGIEPCVERAADPVADGMPSVTLPCLGGGPDVDVSSLRGPMLVSLWAYWCDPCRDEMPILQSFYAEHGDRVPVLGVDYQDTMPGGALALMKETGATYPSLADPYGDLSARDPLPVINGLPFLLLLDADGKVAYVHKGEVTSKGELLELVADHLGVRL